MLYSTQEEIKNDLNFHGVPYNKLLEVAYRQLRAALNIPQKDKTSKFCILMHATFELCHLENISSRMKYDIKTQNSSKLQFAIGELTHVVKEIEKKYNLIDKRSKPSNADLFLKASLMLKKIFQERFSKFMWCRPSRRCIKVRKIALKPISPRNALAKSPVFAVKVSPKTTTESPCSEISGYCSESSEIPSPNFDNFQPVTPLNHPVTPQSYLVTPINHPVTPFDHPVTPLEQPVTPLNQPLSSQKTVYQAIVPEPGQTTFMLDSQRPENLSFYQTYYDPHERFETTWSQYNHSYDSFDSNKGYDIPHCYNFY